MLQGWDIVRNEELERIWKEKYEEFANRTKCKCLTKETGIINNIEDTTSAMMLELLLQLYNK